MKQAHEHRIEHDPRMYTNLFPETSSFFPVSKNQK